MSGEKNIPVLLADDHAIFLEGLRKLLAKTNDIEVVGDASTGHQAVEMTRKLHPSVVVMDIAMPMLNGLEATRQIHQTVPDTKVIILSAHNEDAYVDRAMAFGASAYLDKLVSSHLLVDVIRKVEKGSTFICPSIARRFNNRNQKSIDRNGGSKVKNDCLSSREAEVLQLIAESKANKQIAAELGISIKTVEKHRSHLMRKLDIHDTAGLTRHAIETGIIESSVRVFSCDNGRVTPHSQ